MPGALEELSSGLLDAELELLKESLLTLTGADSRREEAISAEQVAWVGNVSGEVGVILNVGCTYGL